MELDDEHNGLPGQVPEFGAIFMSNAATKRECFRRKIFGLPSSQAAFVEQVKAGMILFLFEFESRRLYGVFQAQSDGAMNIVPQAYRSCGQQFPAQVSISIIWVCSPLSEHEFRGAIKENYYSAKKFNFGLSKAQVHRLLQLFNSKRLKDQPPQRQLMGNTVKKQNENAFGKANRRGHDSSSLNSYRSGIEHLVDNAREPVMLDEDSVDSSGEMRRIAYKCQFLKNKGMDECNVDDDHGTTFLINYKRNSVDELRREADNGSFSKSDILGQRPDLDGKFVAVNSSECSGGGFRCDARQADDKSWFASDGAGTGAGRKKSDGCRSTIRDSVWANHNLSSSYLRDSMDGLRRVDSDEVKFEIGGRVRNNHNVDNDLEPYHRNSCDNLMLVANDDCRYNASVCIGEDGHRSSTRNSLGNECKMNNDFRFLKSTEYLGDSLGNQRGVSGDQDRFTSSNDVMKENIRENLGPLMLNNYLRNSRIEGVPADEHFVAPGYSDEYLCGSKHFPYPHKPVRETDNLLIHDQVGSNPALAPRKESQLNDLPYSASYGDVVTASTDPYNPDFSSMQFRHSSSLHGNCSANFAPVPGSPYSGSRETQSEIRQECLSSHYGPGVDLFPSVRKQMPPLPLEPDSINKCLDATHCPQNKVSLPAPGFNEYLCSEGGISNPLSDTGYFEGKRIGSTVEEPRDISFSDFAVPPVHALGRGNYADENFNLLSYSSGLSKNLPPQAERCYPLATEDKFQPNLRCSVGNEAFTSGAPLSTRGSCPLQKSLCSIQSRSAEHTVSSSISRDTKSYEIIEGRHLDSQKSRPSVFSRLSVAPEVRLQEHDSCTDDDDLNMDTSLDEIMEMLDSNHHHWLKMRKATSGIRKSMNVEKFGLKKESLFCSRKCRKFNMFSSMEMDAEATTADEVSAVETAETTMVVNFRRRSELRKGQGENKLKNENKSNSCDENACKERSSSGQGKRRKLIRPKFS